jgi:hypothetical protein
MLIDAWVGQTTDSSGGVTDAIPWPFQLGLNGVTLGALIAFFIWFNRQVVNGNLYPGTIVTKMLAEKDATIADKDGQLTGKDILIEDQRKTIRAGESTAGTMAKALEQATSNQHWVDIAVQRALGGNAAPAERTPAAEEVTT